MFVVTDSRGARAFSLTMSGTCAANCCLATFLFVNQKKKIKIDQKQLENVESFKYLGSILTDDARCTCEIKCRIAMAKAALNKKRTLFTSTLDLELRKKLVKCYVWSIILYGAGRFGQWIRNTWKVLKCGAGEGWKRSVGLIM